MRFWDSSALVPLFVHEPRSASCRAILRDDLGIAVWCLTRVELHSAIRRLERQGALRTPLASAAIGRVDRERRKWQEVPESGLVSERAERLLATHDLRAADALQLAAALALARGRPSGRPLVTADGKLADAAAREGFQVIVPPAR